MSETNFPKSQASADATPPQRKPETEHIARLLHSYDRRPFLDLLATYLACAPSPEAIARFAERDPGKYMAGLKQLAGVGGYTTEKHEITGTLRHIEELSDSQLEERLQQSLDKLGVHGVVLPPRALPANDPPTEDGAAE